MQLEQHALLVQDNGAHLIDLTAFTLGKAVIKKSDGSLLYLSRDIAAAIGRKKKYNFDKMYYIVGGTAFLLLNSCSRPPFPSIIQNTGITLL